MAEAINMTPSEFDVVAGQLLQVKHLDVIFFFSRSHLYYIYQCLFNQEILFRAELFSVYFPLIVWKTNKKYMHRKIIIFSLLNDHQFNNNSMQAWFSKLSLRLKRGLEEGTVFVNEPNFSRRTTFFVNDGIVQKK